MSFSEQADFSAEHTKEPRLLQRLIHERDTVGSAREYLHALGVYHESVPAHAPNMLQLQRMARLVTNPNNESSYPNNLTNAFYWGELLAYTYQDRAVGETWATSSYKIFNENIVGLRDTMRDESLSHYDDLQRSSDMIIGGLEMADGETMPPVMDQFIIEWSGDITDNQEERWQMILGFRHIIMQAAQTALEYDAYSEHNEQSEIESKQAIEAANEFFEIMDYTEIDDVQANLEPIDDVRDYMMEKYADYRESYGDVDKGDEEALDDISIFLMQELNRELVKSDRIEAGDFIEITGNAVFVICDENLRANNTYVLGKNEFIKGSVEAIAVTEVPSFDAIARIRRAREDIGGLHVEIPKGDVNPLGVMLILTDPVLVGPDGKHLQVDRGVIAGVVLNNPDMDMSKYLL